TNHSRLAPPVREPQVREPRMIDTKFAPSKHAPRRMSHIRRTGARTRAVGPRSIGRLRRTRGPTRAGAAPRTSANAPGARPARTTHSWMRWRYHFPQARFPYAELARVNRERGRGQPEYELIDTGVFDGSRYWAITADYAKAGPTDMCIRVRLENRGSEAA